MIFTEQLAGGATRQQMLQHKLLYTRSLAFVFQVQGAGVRYLHCVFYSGASQEVQEPSLISSPAIHFLPPVRDAGATEPGETGVAR